MNVRELIEALSAVEDQTLEVWLEGCDCSNLAKSIVAEPAIEGRTWRRERHILIECHH